MVGVEAYHWSKVCWRRKYVLPYEENKSQRYTYVIRALAILKFLRVSVCLLHLGRSLMTPNNQPTFLEHLVLAQVPHCTSLLSLS